MFDVPSPPKVTIIYDDPLPPSDSIELVDDIHNKRVVFDENKNSVQEISTFDDNNRMQLLFGKVTVLEKKVITLEEKVITLKKKVITLEENVITLEERIEHTEIS